MWETHGAVSHQKKKQQTTKQKKKTTNKQTKKNQPTHRLDLACFYTT